MIFATDGVLPFLQSWANFFPTWFLYVGACVGHGFWMIVALNLYYSYPLPHRLLKFTRRVDLLIILSGPIFFAYAFDLFNSQQLTWEAGTFQFYLEIYGVFCAFLGLVVAPLAEIKYLLRRPAPQVVAEKVATLDVSGVLGYAPIGRTKHRRKCLLPGNQVFQVEFVEKTLALPRLPAAWNGLKILHLTDLHLCGTPDRDFYKVVIERCREWGTADLVAVTGDVVDSDWHHRWVLPLLGRLSWKEAGLAILGNHDKIHLPDLVRRRLRRAQFRVLGNRWETLQVRGETLAVVGHEGPWFRPAPDVTGLPSEAFKLCLSHTPDNLPWAKKLGIDLMLAGHVHGGQIRLPVLGSVFVPSRFSRHYDCGTFYEAPTLMHVGRGLAGQQPLRFFCKPEVTWLTLVQASQASKEKQ